LDFIAFEGFRDIPGEGGKVIEGTACKGVLINRCEKDDWCITDEPLTSDIIGHSPQVCGGNTYEKKDRYRDKNVNSRKIQFHCFQLIYLNFSSHCGGQLPQPTLE